VDQKRIFQLDVLRGFAILLVMGVHVPAYPIWSTIGSWGVDLFFVLSGFLIANLLFTEYRNTSDIRFARFFVRRALKLYPSFYLLLGLTLLYCFLWRVPFTGRQLLGELLLTQNYLGGIWGHTWSLAVEEHFYILLPLILAFMLRRAGNVKNPFRAIPYTFFAVAATCLILRIVNSHLHPVLDHHIHFQPSHLRADALFFGVFLGYLHNFQPEVVQKLMRDPWRFPVSVVSILALAPALFLPASDPFIYTVGFTLVYIGFGTMLLLSIYQEGRKRPKPGLAVRWIAWMGTYSYTLYLWHVPMAQVFGTLAPRLGNINQYLLHAVYFMTTIVVSVALSKLVEIPALRLRERFFPKPTVEVEHPRVLVLQQSDPVLHEG
jgi:peptidoglycan/LPS O-acetylase OafA/YrhL